MSEENKYDFLLVGGDRRMEYAGEFLKVKGYRVRHIRKTTWEEALEEMKKSTAIIGSVPSSTWSEVFPVERLVEGLRPGQIFFGGGISEKLCRLAGEKGIQVKDILEDESFLLENAVATAEGAIAEAILRSPDNICNSKILIFGGGRCAKTLAKRLRGLHGKVWICARNREQRVWGENFCDGALSFEELPNRLPEFRLLFQTIPERVLDREILKKADQDAILFELASAPGGFDPEEARALGITACTLPGLPGRYCPKAAGKGIAAFVAEQYERWKGV